MTPDEFVSGLKAEIVDRTMDDYHAFYRDFDRAKVAGDRVYGPAFELYDSLPEDKRKVYMDMLRQAMIDAVSGVLAVLDDVHRLKPQQDIFLAGEEDDESGGTLDR